MQFKTLNDNLVAYRHRPDAGPVVVFANALGSDQSIWDNVIETMGRHRATLTYDLRGQGASGITPDPYTMDQLGDDLIALLDHLGLTQIILCGVSIGGMIAQTVATKRPDLIRGLVLCCTGMKIGNADRWNTRIADVNDKGLAALSGGIMDQWFPSRFQSTHTDALTGHKTMVSRNGPLGYANTCAALRDVDLRASTPTITAPTTCIAGGQDGSVGLDVMEQLVGAIAGARLVTLPDAGHLPCLDAPSEVARVIADMIAQTDETLDRQSTGMAVRRAVLGAAHVDCAEAAKSDFDREYQSLITQGAWGTVWASDVISRRERSMITLGLLAALGNFDEVAMHVRATARTGASPADIAEVFQHVAIYAGVPRANHALKIAKATLAEMEADDD